MKVGHYKTLDIEHTATIDEIKKAFYKLAHIHHPDKGGDEKQFKIVNEAYQTLSDPSKRSAYDRTISIRGDSPMGFATANAAAGDWTVYRYEWSHQADAAKMWQDAMSRSESEQKKRMRESLENILRMWRNGDFN